MFRVLFVSIIVAALIENAAADPSALLTEALYKGMGFAKNKIVQERTNQLKKLLNRLVLEQVDWQIKSNWRRTLPAS